MKQLDLELYPPNEDFIGKVISESPYVKILGPIRWSVKYGLTALAQVDSFTCFVALKEKRD